MVRDIEKYIAQSRARVREMLLLPEVANHVEALAAELLEQTTLAWKDIKPILNAGRSD